MNTKRVNMYRNHIQEYYPTVQNLQNDVKSCMENYPHLKDINYNYTACLNVVDGGCFLCYYSDIIEFYRSNGYKFQDKYSNETLWSLYQREMATIIQDLCRNRIQW